MSIKIGNIDVSYLKVGDSDCSIYLGDTLMYSGGTTPPVPPTFEGKWLATYSDLHTESAACDDISAITTGEISVTDLVDAEIGDCVTSIGSSVFSRCKSLTSVTIGNNVASIGNGAFMSCTSLSSVTIPDNVTNIDSNCFGGCSRLTSCTIGSGVTNIGVAAFQYCSKLTNIEIPNSITSIGINCFASCSGLLSITVLATTPPSLGSGVFSSTNNCPIYVPAESVETYKSASGWSDYASRIQVIPSS